MDQNSILSACTPNNRELAVPDHLSPFKVVTSLPAPQTSCPLSYQYICQLIQTSFSFMYIWFEGYYPGCSLYYPTTRLLSWSCFILVCKMVCLSVARSACSVSHTRKSSTQSLSAAKRSTRQGSLKGWLHALAYVRNNKYFAVQRLV